MPTRHGRTTVVLAAAALLALTGSPAAIGAPPPDQPSVATPQAHAKEDHVFHDAATEARLQAATRRATAADAAAAAEAVSAAPSDSGQWGPVIPWNVVGIHNALLSNGKVLAYDSVGDNATETYPVHDHTRAIVFDPATGVQTQVDVSNYNVFCSGLAHLADGKVFLAGGNKDSALNGIVQTHLFDPGAQSWALGPNMAQGRWYPSVTPMANGEQVITSGGPTIPEVYTTNGTLRTLSTAPQSLPLYPWIDVAPDGRAVHTGPDTTYRKLNTSGTGSWQSLGTRDAIDRNYGGHALYDIGKVLVAGGGSSSSTARIVDINPSTPTSTATASMAVGRRQHNLTVLPDGTVLATGGLSSGAGLVDLNAGVYNAEVWNPATGQWRTLAAESVTRQYHSTALLLPDGRVLSSGGGICGTCDNVGYLAKNAQIFSPPYLFNTDGSLAARPAITAAPSTVGFGGTFDVSTPDAASVTKVALVRLGAVTHSNNMEQRYIPLQFTQDGGTLHVTGPANGNIAPPGPYMLFLVNSAGVPSVAAMTTVSTDAPPPPPPPSDDPPTVQLTAPANGASFAFKSTITLTANATDDGQVTKVEFFAGTTKLGEDTTGPYSWTWRNVTPGTYTLTARATDNSAQTTTSTPVTITVRKKKG